MKNSKFLLFFCLSGIFFNLHAQNREQLNWLDFTPHERASLTPSETERIEGAISKGMYHDYWVVAPRTLEEVIINDQLSINIPARSLTQNFKRTWVGANGNGYGVWEGEGEDPDDYATILIKDDIMFGHIRSRGEDYMLYSLEDSRTSVLLRKTKPVLTDTSKFCGIESGAREHIDLKQVNDVVNLRTGAWQNCEVRTLIYYTPDAVNEDPNVTQTALTAIAETNAAFRRSAVSENYIQLVSAGVELLNPLPQGWTEGSPAGGDMGADIETLIAYGTAQARRNTLGADIVVCLTSDDYFPFGIAAGDPGNFDFLDPERAYAIIEAPTAVTELIFAHEVGHLFDCRHKVDNDGVSYAHGHSFTKWFKTYRTILDYNGDNNTGIPYYSNPNVYYKNRATGRSDRDNARRLRDRGCAVANYRTTNNPTLMASVAGPFSASPFQYVTFQADVEGGGPGLYSYEWRTSTSGTGTGPVLSTSSNVSVSIPDDNGNGNSFLYIHLKVTSADGQVRNVVHAVYIQPSGNGWRAAPELREMEIYPNPASEKIVLSFEAIEEGQAQVLLCDSFGRIIHKEDMNHTSGRILHKCDIGTLSPGVYIAIIQLGNQQLRKRFIKQN